MRIISGNLKGRKIAQPNSKNTRPLKDLTKESIFNIMEHSNLLKFSFEKSTIFYGDFWLFGKKKWSPPGGDDKNNIPLCVIFER